MSHDNSHDDNRGGSQRRPLLIAFFITATFLVIEVIGGIITNSLALLADAGHMATDVAALGLSIFAIWLARRPATSQRSYGFHRAEVLAALINAATLVAISIYIFWEAFGRIGEPPEIDSGPMLAVAIAGLMANLASAWVLMRGGGHEHNLNTRGAYLHVVGDALGSVAAIIAALVMLVTGWYLADPILSAGIGVLILFSSWRLMRESVEVLLEATPKSIDAEEVKRAIAHVDDIAGVHDLHIWTVTSGLIAMSAHVEIEDEHGWQDVLGESTRLLRERFGIAHVTLQPEPVTNGDRLFDGCSLDTPEGQEACCMAVGMGRIPERHHGHQH